MPIRVKGTPFPAFVNVPAGAEAIAARPTKYYRYVDGHVTSDGNGKGWGTAFKYIKSAIAEANKYSGKGVTIFIAPGFYLEGADEVATLSASDVTIMAAGLPEQTVWFGSGTTGAVDAATDDLLKVTGGNLHLNGLSMFVYSATKKCIRLNATAGGYAGSFNIIENVHFSPQAQDGMGYCIHIDGASANIIRGCFFEGAALAGILMSDLNAVHNPTRNEIIGNIFRGCHVGIAIQNAVHHVSVIGNHFQVGEESGEDMTNAITGNASSSGRLHVAGNYFDQTTANDISDAGALTLVELGNYNTT